jgi:hypothetical protein
MKKLNLEAMPTDELVKLFAAIGVAQDQALLGSQFRKFRRLFNEMEEVSHELKRRRGDQRGALLSLFNYPSMQVRLQAAKHTLAVAPVEARRQIEEIAASQWYPQAGEAGMSLDNLDNGIFKPS